MSDELTIKEYIETICKDLNESIMEVSFDIGTDDGVHVKFASHNRVKFSFKRSDKKPWEKFDE